MAAENDVRSYLNTLSLGVPVYCGPVRPAEPPSVPYAAAFCLETGGPTPEPYMDGSRLAYRRMRVQVRVRGEPDGSYQTTRDLANTIWSAMQQPPSTMTGSYVRVTCEQSLPLYMGRDDLQCHEYSVNVVLEKRV